MKRLGGLILTVSLLIPVVCGAVNLGETFRVFDLIDLAEGALRGSDQAMLDSSVELISEAIPTLGLPAPSEGEKGLGVHVQEMVAAQQAGKQDEALASLATLRCDLYRRADPLFKGAPLAIQNLDRQFKEIRTLATNHDFYQIQRASIRMIKTIADAGPVLPTTPAVLAAVDDLKAKTATLSASSVNPIELLIEKQIEDLAMALATLEKAVSTPAG